MKKSIFVFLGFFSAMELPVDAQTCAIDEPSVVTSDSFSYETIGGTAKLIGHDELTGVSSPGKRYRQRSLSGTMNWAKNLHEWPLVSHPSSYSASGSVPLGGWPFTIDFTASLTPIGPGPNGGIIYEADFQSPNDVYGTPATQLMKIVAAGVLAGNFDDVPFETPGEQKELFPSAGSAPYAVVTGIRVGWDHNLDSQKMLSPEFEQFRDEWNFVQTWDQSDATGGTTSSSETSVSYVGTQSSFPLSSGGVDSGVLPSIGNYSLLVNETVSGNERVLTGTDTGVDRGIPNGMSIAAGTYTEKLSQEDSDEDALRRALDLNGSGDPTSPYVAKSSASVAFRESRTAAGDIDFAFSKVSFSVPVYFGCPGEYMVEFYYASRLRGSSDDFTESDQPIRIVREFKESHDTLLGSFDVIDLMVNFEGTQLPIELDRDYQVSRIVIIRGCGALEAGSMGSDRGSVHVQLGLGRRIGGGAAGMLRLESDDVTSALYTPSALVALTPTDSDDIDVVLSSGVLRQVKAPAVLADIIVVDPDTYEVQFYAGSDVGDSDPVSGIYALTGSPFVTYRFDNPDASPSGNLEISEIRGGSTRVTTFSQDATSGDWLYSKGNGLYNELVEVTAITGGRTERVSVYDENDITSSVTENTIMTYPWGEETVSEIRDPDGLALETSYSFEDDPTSGAYGKVIRQDNPDGSYTEWRYDSTGRRDLVTQPWGDAAAASVMTTETTYGILVDADGDGFDEGLETIIERVDTTETGRRYIVRWSSPVELAGESFERRSDITTLSAGAAWDAAANLVTETLSYRGGEFAGRTRRTLNPDGTASLTEYVLEIDNSTTITTAVGAPNGTFDAIVDGASTVSTVDPRGRVIAETTTDIASSLVIESWSTTTFDYLERPTRVDHTDGTFALMTYICCGLGSETDRFGRTVTYGYDDLARRNEVTADGITTRTVFDAEGRTKAMIRVGTDASEITLASYNYNLAGQLTESRDARNRLTTHSEVFEPVTGVARRVTTTNPDLGTRIEDYNVDGSLQSVSGTAAYPATYAYSLEGSAKVVQETLLGDAGETTEWIKTYTDFAGRSWKTVFADNAADEQFYNVAGQLDRRVDPDGVTTLFDYESTGERSIVAVDLNANNQIDFTGTDRITRTLSEVATRDSTTVQRTTTEVWQTDSTDVATTVLIVESSFNGLKSWQTVPGPQGISGANGLTTTTVVTLDGSGGQTTVVTTPANTTSTEVYADGLLQSSTIADSTGAQVGATTFGYDAHNRLETSADARNGTTTYTYYDDDQIHTVTTPDPDPTSTDAGYEAQVTSYTYDSAGRTDTITQPDATVVTTTYYPDGQVKLISGSRTYPQEYTYDSQGRLKTLTTWQDYSTTSGVAITTWNYDPQRGFLSSKKYQDNTGPAYTYTAAGRLETRTWERGIITTYGYTAVGDLEDITYSDATPTVAYTYDRQGRQRTRTDAAGVSTFAYDPTGQLDTETYSGGMFDGLVIDRGFDSLARPNALAVSSIYSIGMTYDDASRLHTVTSGDNVATYGYLANSPLVETLTMSHQGNTRLTTTKVYDYLDRLTSITNQPSADSALSHTYRYNAANQRTRATREDNRYWHYDYDALGQVTAGRKHLPNGDIINGLDYGWTYDDIGNRETATTNGSTATYTPNLLNQYDQRTVPGVVDIFGEANASATVTMEVDGGLPQAVNRQDTYFHQQILVDNSISAQRTDVTVTGVRNLAGPSGEDAVTEETVSAYTAQSLEVFDYDADGNLKEDAKWTYTWNGENRLVAMESTATSVAVGETQLKLEFSYDGQGRRIEKKVFDWSGTAWTLATHLRFLYNGWNMIAELDGLNSNATVRTYVWGLDLSGTIQGAGGVGGLVFAEVDGSATHAASFDGNGNVVGYVDVANGVFSSVYDYNAFGELSLSSGFGPETPPIGFSSKYFDIESDKLYYGYRYYDSSLGRWINRDPIWEFGGLNIFGMIGNDALNQWDYLGLATCAKKLAQIKIINEQIKKHKRSIGGITKEIQKRIGEFAEDPKGLPWNLPGAPRRATRSGHIAIINELKAKLSERTGWIVSLRQQKGRLWKEYNQCMAKKAAQKGLKGITKKGAGALTKKVPIIGAVFFICDWSEGGFVHAANEVVWPVSEIWVVDEIYPSNVSSFDGVDDDAYLEANHRILEKAETFIDQNQGGVGGKVE